MSAHGSPCAGISFAEPSRLRLPRAKSRDHRSERPRSWTTQSGGKTAPLALAPQPGLAQLDDLIDTAREAGLQVEVEVASTPSSLPPGLDLTAYRIVQEALTNVLKHANAQCVRVGITFQRNQLELDVSDDGPATGPSVVTEGAGHGLIGMRERATVFGGTITAGTSSAGGWTVHARLPVPVGSL
jgi:signal transduction histidine kinase